MKIQTQNKIMSLPIDQKKLEKRYKDACKRRFGIPIEEIDKISNMYEGYLMIDYKDQLYLISDLDGCHNFLDYSILHLEADHYIPDEIWASSFVNEEIHKWKKYEAELYLDLNKEEFAFVSSISPSIIEEGYWELLYVYPEIYSKAVLALYKVCSKAAVIDELLDAFEITDGYLENLFMGCKYDLSVTYLDKFEEKGKTFDFKIEFFTVDDSCSFWAMWENHKRMTSDD